MKDDPGKSDELVQKMFTIKAELLSLDKKYYAKFENYSCHQALLFPA
jgi:hypothetical protein